MTLEPELISTVTNVGCLRLWVFVFLCLLVVFSATRSGFQTFGERTLNLPRQRGVFFVSQTPNV